MRLTATNAHLRKRIAQHGEEYGQLLAQAVVESNGDSFVVETEHIAFKVLKARYEPLTRQQAVKAQADLFHSLWDALHGMEDPTPEKLAKFATRIPCGSCQKHWRQVMTESPPDLSSAEAFFVWSVDAHNAVNRHLGKPLFSLADARIKYPSKSNLLPARD